MKKELEFNKNEDALKLLLTDVKKRLEKVKLGGGKKKIEKQHAQGKMTARERIASLLDSDRPSFEIGAFAAEGMYSEHGGCPAAGVIVVIGWIEGRQCIVAANDATVKAGAWFPMTGKKNLRAQEIALENHLPIIYLVDSAGVYLPMQDEIFPDKEQPSSLLITGRSYTSYQDHCRRPRMLWVLLLPIFPAQKSVPQKAGNRDGPQ